MIRRTYGCAVVLVVFALAACAGAPSLGVDAGAATATVVRGDEVTRAVTVARGGVAGPVSLAVSGVPAGVTASFGESVLPDGATSTTLTLAVAPAAVEATSTLTITAVAGGRAASTDLALTVESLTVTGRTVDAFGIPRGGVTIGIQGMTTVSGTDGAFVLPGVSVPYDLATFVAGVDPLAHVFVGLRADDVELFPYGTVPGPSPFTATVTGALPAAVPAGHRASVCVEGLDVPLYGCDTLVAGEVDYSVSLRYAGGTVDARVHAILVELGLDDRPVSYPAYGTVDTVVFPGGTSSGVDIGSTTNPAESTITLAANVPAGFATSNVTLGIQLSAGFTLTLGGTSLAGDAPGSFPVPLLAGATYGASVSADAAVGNATTIGWRFGLTAGASATVDLPAPPVLQSPADGATGVGVGSTLRLSTSPGGVATFIVGPVGGTGASLAITTIEDRVTLPDLTYLGFALVPATEHDWAVIVAPGVSTPDRSGIDWLRRYAEALYALTASGPTPSAATGSVMTTGDRSFFTP